MSIIKRGDRFGALEVLGLDRTAKGKDFCFCKCDCGQVGISVNSNDLKTGLVTCCKKCLGYEVRRNDKSIYNRHIYAVWLDMISRCENPKRPYYHLYGGRGIKVCEEWRNRENGYSNFYAWAMENGYKYEPIEPKPNAKRVRNKWALDRIDNNGDYCPENCRFADIKTQNANRRADVEITYRGKKKKTKDFIKEYNSTVPFFYYLLRQGMKEIEALDYIYCLQKK